MTTPPTPELTLTTAGWSRNARGMWTHPAQTEGFRYKQHTEQQALAVAHAEANPAPASWPAGWKVPK